MRVGAACDRRAAPRWAAPPPVCACGAAHRARPSARRRARPRARRQAAPRSWRAPRACATCRRRWRRAWRAGTRSATSAGGSTWACRSARAAAAGSCAWACAAARSATRSRRARGRPAVELPSSHGAPAGKTELTADSEPSRVFRGLINGQAPACQRMGFASHPAECPTCRRNSPARRMCKLAPAGWWHGRGAAPVTGQGIIHLTLQVRRLLAAEARLLARYERSLLESYVEDNAMTRWCPRCPSPLNPDPNPNSCPHRWQPFSPCWRACDGCARGSSPCVSRHASLPLPRAVARQLLHCAEHGRHSTPIAVKSRRSGHTRAGAVTRSVPPCGSAVRMKCADLCLSNPTLPKLIAVGAAVV